jgi:hypothetical protein
VKPEDEIAVAQHSGLTVAPHRGMDGIPNQGSSMFTPLLPAAADRADSAGVSAWRERGMMMTIITTTTGFRGASG